MTPAMDEELAGYFRELTREELFELAEWHEARFKAIYLGLLQGMDRKPPELIVLPAPAP